MTSSTSKAQDSSHVADNAVADALTDIVREKYGDAARRVLDAGRADACCSPVNSCCGGAAFNGSTDPITSNLYVNGETDDLPSAAVLASLGCGNPTALAQLNAGETVLDLGSGGGIDVILSARRVGRFAVSDVVVRGAVPPVVRRSMELWVGCVAGALQEPELTAMLTGVGFTGVGFTGAEIEPARVYRNEDARSFLEEAGIAVDEHLDDIDGKFMAAFVRATKPLTA